MPFWLGGVSPSWRCLRSLRDGLDSFVVALNRLDFPEFGCLGMDKGLWEGLKSLKKDLNKPQDITHLEIYLYIETHSLYE